MKRKTESENKNPAAVALGRMAAGVPKRFSGAERARRRQQMLAINRARKAKKT